MPTIQVGPDSALELQQIADSLGNSRKVVVVTGAGISTNCGIPDFRSEDGLYSMIQTQYDAALKNPPWEESNTFDIDDRPKKKRKPWYFEIVKKEDGCVVGTIDEDEDTAKRPEDASLNPQQQPRRSSRSRSTNTTTSNSRSSTPSVQLSDDSSLSSCPSRIFEPSFLNSNDESSVTSTEERCTSRPNSSHSSNASHSSQLNHTSNEHTIVPITSQPTAPRIATLQREESSFMSTTSVDSSIPTSSQSSSRSLPNLKGRDLFDAQIWQDPQKTSIHYMFISSLRNKVREVATTTEIHKFIRTLRDGGRLVRNYTQNIDLLEEREGLSTEISKGPGNRSRFNPKTQRELRPEHVTTESPHFGGCEVVPLHGTLAGLRCPLCREHTSWDEPATLAATLSGTAPDCPSCTAYSARRTSHGRRGFSIGRLRPDIVLYGEEHPNANLIGEMVTHDLGLGPDVLLIIGTSLRVHGLKVMIREFAKSVHTRGGKVVFVNRTKPPESTWGDVIDYWVEWDCDAWVLDLKLRRGDIWLPQGATPPEESRRKEIREASTRPLSTTQRPQCLRDDKMNAAFVTFKILDQLRLILDAKNKIASRPMYWKPFTRRSTLTSAAPPPPEPIKKPISKAPRKPLPKELPEPATAKSIQSKKRKSEPARLELNENQVLIVSEAWQSLRMKCPKLPELPPELQWPLSHFESNKKPSYFTPFQLSNHYPNVGGGSSWPLGKINLATHPPSGPPIAGLSPKAEVKRPTPTHSYGTRARGKGKSSSPIMVDTTKALPASTEDTIVSTPIEEPQGESRIKRMSSIGNIVSGVSSPSSEAFYSAEETIADG